MRVSQQETNGRVSPLKKPKHDSVAGSHARCKDNEYQAATGILAAKLHPNFLPSQPWLAQHAVLPTHRSYSLS